MSYLCLEKDNRGITWSTNLNPSKAIWGKYPILATEAMVLQSNNPLEISKGDIYSGINIKNLNDDNNVPYERADLSDVTSLISIRSYDLLHFFEALKAEELPDVWIFINKTNIHMARFAIRCGLFFAVTKPGETEPIVEDGKVLIGATREHLVTNGERIVTRVMERAERIRR